MVKYKSLGFIGFVAKVGGGLLALLLFCAAAAVLVRPDLDAELPAYSDATLAKLDRMRDLGIGGGEAPSLYVDVDYSTGASGAWYPKGESPLLAELAGRGALPPVGERIGPEPVVLQGEEGIGQYGGTMVRGDDGTIMSHRLSYASLLRYSPCGLPIVPHIAKSYDISEDNRIYTFTLRRGMRWSDGHPFTADDIMYWWENEQADTNIVGRPSSFMLINGKVPQVSKIDDLTVRIEFPEPNARFLYKVAGFEGSLVVSSPRHYLEPFHPVRGNRELIDKRKAILSLHNDLAVYSNVKGMFNPEHPRLWPWIYRAYKTTPPQVFVRNPYYFAVDAQGNQLPYIDRVVFRDISERMLPIAASGGEISMQQRSLRYDDYTLLMTQQEQGDYTVRHWQGSRSWWTLFPNQARKVVEGEPDSSGKRQLLASREFRQALSLAINREQITKAFYHNQAMPGNDVAGPESPFHSPKAFHAFTEYDPARANAMLDALGLTKRDRDGYRTTRDGERLTFRISYTSWTGLGPGHFVVDDWATVGIRAILKEQSRSLYVTQRSAGVHDFYVFEGEGEYLPVISPVHLQGTPSIGRWFDRGGLYGSPEADERFGCLAPAEDSPLRKAMELSLLLDNAVGIPAQKAIIDQINDIYAENIWNINICASTPILAVVKNGLRNVPEKLIATFMFQSPGNAGPELFYFENASTEPAIARQIQEVIETPVLTPQLTGQVSTDAGMQTGEWIASLIRWSFVVIGLLLLVLCALRSPHILKRLLVMVPTLLLMSVLVFIVIQLPPGDFITTRIQAMAEAGDEVNPQEIIDLEEMFFVHDSPVMRYVRWMGIRWFVTFDKNDTGLLQGNLGRSMQTLQPVSEMVGERIQLTFAISLGTILLTWLISIPIGIYSAVRQYTVGDYVLTFMGFIGMCVPGFLLAIILMYISQRYFGHPITGLFSAEYAAQEGWTMGKFIDLLKHIWVPITILGVGGTASGIRFMRANLLDELRKPYVTTARAKGVPPLKLLLKYPVRLALNPFISGIGGIFPELVSGGAIVAIVLSLPTVSPLMLSALMSEDMYMAGSMLMILSLLSIMGTLVSDLLLLLLDPRIRVEGRSK